MPLLTLYSIADAHVFSTHPNNNYGNYEFLNIGRGSSGEGSPISEIFTKHDLSVLRSNDIINSAILRFFQYDDDDDWLSPTIQVAAELADAAWDEMGITWGNKPGSIAGIQALTSFNNNIASSVDFDVKAHVEAIRDGQNNNGFRLRYTGTSSATRKYFRSRQYSDQNKWPVLLIDVSHLPDKGSTPQINPASYPESNITISWNAVAYATAYYVDYRVNGGAWQRFTATTQLSVEMDISTRMARGDIMDISIVPYNAYGTGERSNNTTIMRNRKPNALAAAPIPSATLVEPGTTIRLSFTNAGDPDGNLAGYEVAMQNVAGVWYNNGQIMGTNPSPTATYVDVQTTGWARGGKWKFFARGYDSRGVRGDWSPASELVTINSAPPTPSSITVTPSPFEKTVTVSWAAVTDPDGNLANYVLQRRYSNDKVNWTDWETIATQIGLSKIDEPPVADGGLVQYQVQAVDTLGQTSGWRTSGQISREDGSGLKIKQISSWAKTDIIINGVKHEVMIKQPSGFVEAEK